MSRIARPALAILPGLAALLAGWPILDNDFFGDDYGYLFELATVGPRDLLTAPFAGHMLFVRNLVFYVCFAAFGMDARGYFAVVLATHVLASLLVGMVARRLTENALVACLAGVLFAVTPANHGTLGWYSASGHALAAVAALVALLVVAPAPGDESPLAPRMAVLAALAMLVASQSFGTGAAAALAFPIVALLLRPATLRAPLSRAIVAAVPLLVLAVWLLMTGMRTRLNPTGIESTRAMALLATDYLRIGLMAMHLLGSGVDWLLVGLPFTPTDYGKPVAVAAIVLAGLAVVTVLVLGDGRARRVLLACLVVAVTCYLAISAGRASLYVAWSRDNLVPVLVESTRYHYLAQSLLALAVAVTLAEIGRRLPPALRRMGAGVLGLWTVWAIASLYYFPPWTPRLGERERQHVQQTRLRLEATIRSSPPGTTVCLPVEPWAIGLGYPGLLGLFVLHHPTDDVEGRRIRFVSSNPKVLALRETSARLRTLILPDGACPPAGAKSG